MLIDTLASVLALAPDPELRTLSQNFAPDIVYFDRRWLGYGTRGTPLEAEIRKSGWNYLQHQFRLPHRITAVEDPDSVVVFEDLAPTTRSGPKHLRRFLIFAPAESTEGISSPLPGTNLLAAWMLVGGTFMFDSDVVKGDLVAFGYRVNQKMIFYLTDLGALMAPLPLNEEKVPVIPIIKEHIVTATEQLLTLHLPGRIVVEEIPRPAGDLSETRSVYRSFSPEEFKEFERTRTKTTRGLRILSQPKVAER